MKTLYKVFASIGMIALSTAAAVGVRHLTRVAKQKKDEENNVDPQDAAPKAEEAKADDEADDAQDASENDDEEDADDSEDEDASDNAEA